MPIQFLDLNQDAKDPNRRWLNVTTEGGNKSQYTLDQNQYAQLAGAGIRSSNVFNDPMYYNKGAFSADILAPYANEATDLSGYGAGQGFWQENRDIAKKIVAGGGTTTPYAGDLANNPTEQARLAAGAWGGASNPFSNGTLAVPGTTPTAQQQTNLQSNIANANPALANIGDNTPRTRDASGNLVAMTPPASPTQAGQVQNAAVQTPTPPAPRTFEGLTAAQVAQLDAAVARGLSGKDDKANVDYATKRFGYKPPSSPATTTTATQTTTRSFPGLTPEQVAQLDAAVARNYIGDKDRANVNYAMQKYGYTPPTAGTATGSTNQPAATPPGTTPPGATTQPVEAPKSYLDVLKEQLSTLNKPSDEETNTQNLIDNLLTSKAMGLNDISEQAIAMPFITGQSKNVEARAKTQLDTLERKLARLQADREAKRQAAVDVADIEEKKAKEIADRAEKEEKKKAGEEEEIQKEVFDLIQKGYTPLSGPSALAGLSEDQLLRLPGTDIIMKKPEAVDKLLTPTEAARLGVPYGTTQKEAANMGKTPSFGKTSGGTKSGTTTSGKTGTYNTQLERLVSTKGSDGYVNTGEYKTIRNSLKNSTLQREFDQNFAHLLNPNDPTAKAIIEDTFGKTTTGKTTTSTTSGSDSFRF